MGGEVVPLEEERFESVDMGSHRSVGFHPHVPRIVVELAGGFEAIVFLEGAKGKPERLVHLVTGRATRRETQASQALADLREAA